MLNTKKVDFHIGWPVLPPGLAVMDRELGAPGESGIGAMTVELFTVKGSELSPFEAGLTSLGQSRAVSMTQAGQCRLTPLTQFIPDLNLLILIPQRSNCDAMGSRDQT